MPYNLNKKQLKELNEIYDDPSLSNDIKIASIFNAGYIKAKQEESLLDKEVNNIKDTIIGALLSESNVKITLK